MRNAAMVCALSLVNLHLKHFLHTSNSLPLSASLVGVLFSTQKHCQ